ncbi:hypothetical protein U1Q18_000047 [Sarracenia purpurea var. burkii]
MIAKLRAMVVMISKLPLPPVVEMISKFQSEQEFDFPLVVEMISELPLPLISKLLLPSVVEMGMGADSGDENGCR